MGKLENAELYAKEKYLGMKRKDGMTPYYNHLENVVNRLKNLGMADDDILSAAWLHDTIKDTNSTFDDIEQIFGSKIAVLVLSLTKDKNLPKGQQEQQYVKQLQQASWEAKLIKLCDISANLKDIRNLPISKSKRIKVIKKKIHYLNIIKPDLIQNKSKVPGIQKIIDGINEILKQYEQRPFFI